MEKKKVNASVVTYHSEKRPIIARAGEPYNARGDLLRDRDL